MKSKNRVGEVGYNNQGEKMTIVAYRRAIDIDVMFEDGTIITNKTYTNFKDRKSGILNPNFKSVCGIGYVGIGEKKDAKIYHVWSDMIYRCYDKTRQKRQLSYIGCSVDDDWHCYQNFAKWYRDNTWTSNEKLYLDKDIFNKNNKVYSSYNCILVPRKINNLFIKPSKSESNKYPIGVHFHKMANKFISQISTSDGHIHIGSFDTPEDAFLAYKAAKEKEIKKMADYYNKKYLNFPKKLYDVMYNYEVEICD